VAHYLRQLHFAKFVQLLGFEHPALYLPNSLRVDLHILVANVLCLDAVSAKLFSGAAVPRVNFQVMLATHSISLEEGLLIDITYDTVRDLRVAIALC